MLVVMTAPCTHLQREWAAIKQAVKALKEGEEITAGDGRLADAQFKLYEVAVKNGECNKVR
jgi:hypothetical protein